jgi:PAS domain S-box-containing protein
VHQFELNFTLPSGDEKILEVIGSPILLSGKIDSFLLTAYDITEREKARLELAESELKLKNIIENSTNLFYSHSVDHKITFMSPQVKNTLGYEPEEVMKRWTEFITDNPINKKAEELTEKAIKTGRRQPTYELEMQRKDGRKIMVEVREAPVVVNGEVESIVGSLTDITERKQAEDNFKNSIDESPLGIRIVKQEGKTVYVNKALLEMYEFSSFDEYINTKAIERYTEQSYQEHQERKKLRQKGGDTSDYEISIRRKNGEIRYLKVWRKEVIWNREKHFQVINQDITDLKRLNTDLILAKEKAEESDRLKSAFLSNMSHEIRTPMNGILGFTSLLKAPQLTGDTRDKYIQIIEKSGKRMLDTINDIVDISKIEAGQVEVSKNEVSVNKLLQEQFNFFVCEAEAKGLELIYKPIVSDNDSLIITDQHKLESILTNLIKNAIKYTETGNITFGYAIKSVEGKDVCEFYVKDTGIGIPENRTKAIFNRFEQADIDDTKVFEGSGLGLAISKSYVEMLGGTITVNSEVGHGSNFTFSIPYIRQNQKESGAKQNGDEESGVSLKNLSIIVAEDDEVSKMFLETILENKFSEIIYTSTGKETIDKCRENPDTNIILMDIKMPDIDGFTATKLIRKFNKDVIIIAQTAYGLAGDKEKAIEVGCDDYIAKPIQKEKLLEKIQVCLNKKAFNNLYK